MSELKFDEAGMKHYEWLLTRYPTKEAVLLPALRIAEEQWGNLGPAEMRYVADLMGLSPAKVYGVFTFYTHFRGEGTGTYHLQVCSTLSCALRGSEDVVEHIKKRLGIELGETTEDGLFTLSKVECLASCDTAPMLQCNDDYHEGLSLDDVDRLLDHLRAEAAKGGSGVSFEPILTKYRHEKDSHTMAFYKGHGGYENARKAMQVDPDALIEEVKKSNLRGRGGAGFPAGVKWGFVPKQTDKPKYLVVNADESEPGTFKDRVIMETDPHLLLEGIVICAWAVGINSAYIYIRGELVYAFHQLVNAVKEAYAEGFLGEGIFGTDFKLDVTVHRGAGAYICGEETGMLTSLEGERGQPKLKPPFPAVEGLFGCPTVVNNVETIANLPVIVERGADWYKTVGPEASPGPKLYCVSGHVERPGTYEFAMGVNMLELINEHCGGVWKGRKLKAVIPGGSSAHVLRADECDVDMDIESLQKAGSMLGSAGVIVMDETTCMVDALLNVMRFYHHESCGQCTPCREGTGWLEKVARRIKHGYGRREDLELINSICDRMIGRTICVLADAAAFPATSIIEKFRDEFVALIERGSPAREAAGTASGGVHV